MYITKSEFFLRKNVDFFKKKRRVDVYETLLSDYQEHLKYIITGDETWIQTHDSEITDQSSEYRRKGERRRQSRPKIKVMLIVFFDHCDMVHYEFLPSGQTVKKEYYLSVIRRLRRAIHLKRPEL